MQEYTRFFGLELRRLRLEKEISLWNLALKIPYHLRNIQRIEKGDSHPGITLAFRLLDALETSPGIFFNAVIAKYDKFLPQSISPLRRVAVNYQAAAIMGAGGQKSVFGHLLAQARTSARITQTAMARAAGYNLRNINAVEKGKQEPGIMTALALVMTTGVDAGQFFDTLRALRNTSPDRSDVRALPR